MGTQDALAALREREAVLQEVEALRHRARAARDEAIREAYDNGVAMSLIAQTTGYTVSNIRQIIKHGGSPRRSQRGRPRKSETKESDPVRIGDTPWSYWLTHFSEGRKEQILTDLQPGPNSNHQFYRLSGTDEWAGYMSWDVLDDTQDFLMSLHGPCVPEDLKEME